MIRHYGIGLGRKLIASYVMVALLSFGTAAVFLSHKLERHFITTLGSSLAAQAALIENQLNADKVRAQDLAFLEQFVKDAAARAKCRVTLIDLQGRVLADSERTRTQVLQMDNHLGRTEIRLALARGSGIDIRKSPTLKIDMLYAAVPVRQKGGAPCGILRLAMPLEDVARASGIVRTAVVFGLLIALGLALALGAFFSLRTVYPLRRMIHVSGRFSEGDFRQKILPGPNDEIGALAGTLNDMAARLESKIRELSLQNQKLAAIFDSMIEGIIVVDREGRIVSVNASIERIFNVSAGVVRGELFLEAIRNNDLSALISGVLKGGGPVSGELTLAYPVRGIFQINATPIFDGGSVNGCLAVVHDITEMRRLETIRRDFVANVSHELKTPLTSIKGFVETLLEGALDDRENNRQFLKIIQDHTDRIRDLIDDLLSLSHLESKEISLDKTPVNLRRQVEEVILGFRVQLKKKGIDMRNDVPEGLTVSADRNMVVQVFTNLIDNAIKFNKDRGIITIRAELSGNTVRACVEDTGLGMPSRDLERVFERFYRVDKARSRELGGTGLGLSIVKHIIELHGGAVGVESTEGIGSRFWFTLPQ